MAADWSRTEVEVIVADYLEMLASELRGLAYSKAAHRRKIQPLLEGRTEGSIERKHGNISAVLIELGLPYIEGYKPFANYQQLLFDVVASRLDGSPEIENLVSADVDIEVVQPSVDDILAALVSAPMPTRRAEFTRERSPIYREMKRRPRVDYLKREAENTSLGSAGEFFVLNYERARLLAAGKDHLANKIEHVSETHGDGDGFDILSYEESGRERLIEVKTTKYGVQTPFFVTENEVKVSAREAERYCLYRVFAFRRLPKLFNVPGSISAEFELKPTQYLARIA